MKNVDFMKNCEWLLHKVQKPLTDPHKNDKVF